MFFIKANMSNAESKVLQVFMSTNKKAQGSIKELLYKSQLRERISQLNLLKIVIRDMYQFIINVDMLIFSDKC